MNLDQLEASFRVDADDVAKPHLFSSTDVIGWLNEAQDEACIRGKLIFDKTTDKICTIEADPETGSVYPINEAINEIVHATITDANGCITTLGIKDRIELDRIRPSWRTTTQRPVNIIHRDNTIEFDSVLDQAYTLNLEVHRLPLCKMVKEADKPEINLVHHKFLIYWALHRAYLKPDADTFNQDESDKALFKFEQYFGERPSADMRKAENADRPHSNKAYW
jgi:hypothetical protein